MMKKMMKKILREYCPNIPLVRRKLNEAKLREINKYSMTLKDIQAGERDPIKRREFVARYSEKWPKYYGQLEEKFNEYIRRCISVAKRPDLEELRIKVLFDCFAYGFMPDEYFAYELEKKDSKEKHGYISNRDRYNMVYHLNDIIDVTVYYDKYLTYRKFREYYGRDAISIEKENDYTKFMGFIKKHTDFVIKDVALSKGNSVELVDINTCEITAKQLFDRMIADGKYIVEERVLQSSVMAALNPSSVNTIRCITFGTKEGIKIGPCFLKIGQGGSFVDNGGQGGILVGIDNKTGILNTAGYDEFLTEYQKHPDTGIQFIGYQLPDWKKLLALVERLSVQTPTVKYIGWDMAHTEKGWVIIEGNGSGQLIGPQIVWKRGFKEELKELLSH